MMSNILRRWYYRSFIKNAGVNSVAVEMRSISVSPTVWELMTIRPFQDLFNGLGCKKKADALRRLPFEKRLASLEVELESKHEVPRILTAGDIAERGCSWSIEHIRRSQIGMVECVQEVGAELQAH